MIFYLIRICGATLRGRVEFNPIIEAVNSNYFNNMELGHVVYNLYFDFKEEINRELSRKIKI